MGVRWLKTNFAESFEAWIHIKILRIFSESVLRYGLPVCFQAMLILPELKAERKLREILKKIYGQLDSTITYTECDYDIPPGLGMNPTEYFPYVSTRININYRDIGKILVIVLIYLNLIPITHDESIFC